MRSHVTKVIAKLNPTGLGQYQCPLQHNESPNTWSSPSPLQFHLHTVPLLSLPSVIPILSDLWQLSSHTHHTIISTSPRHCWILVGPKPPSKDASDMVTIILMPTILPVWLRNTQVRPVWSWLGDALASLCAHGCLWPVMGPTIVFVSHIILCWRIPTHWSLATLQHCMHSITVTEALTIKGGHCYIPILDLPDMHSNIPNLVWTPIEDQLPPTYCPGSKYIWSHDHPWQHKIINSCHMTIGPLSWSSDKPGWITESWQH